MKEPRFPGFTAEASLYKARTVASGVGYSDESGPNPNSVQPAASVYIDGIYVGEGGIVCDFGRCNVVIWSIRIRR